MSGAAYSADEGPVGDEAAGTDDGGAVSDADEVMEVEIVDDGDEVIDAEVVGAGAAGGATLANNGSIDSIAVDIAALTHERDEYLGALQRLQADFENYRKRVVRQQEEQSARAALDLVGKLLPVLDVLDLAHAHLSAPSEVLEPGALAPAAPEAQNGAEAEAVALRQARSMLLDTLRKEGLDRVDQHGVAFDPSVHDAVAHAEDDEGGDEVRVDEVLRAGYLWRGQVLRPAMVRVRG